MERVSGLLESVADQQSFLKDLRRDMDDFFDELVNSLRDDHGLARDILHGKEDLVQEMGALQRRLEREAEEKEREAKDAGCESDDALGSLG